MVTRLPLHGLRVFAEIAAQGSLKKAATALHVTTGAVSQQLKALETRLGSQLVIRGQGTINLTPTGSHLLRMIEESFEQIESAFGAVATSRARATLTISTLGSFAAAWLGPRLPRFAERHPDIELRIETTGRLVDLHREPFDLCLRYGGGHYPGLHSTRFLAPALLAVASPARLAHRPIEKPADCLAHARLQDSLRRDWPFWFAGHGIRDLRAAAGPSFEDDLLLLHAAVNGQGIALIRDIYGRSEIEAGSLTRLFEPATNAPGAYYLATRPERARDTRIRAFADWITAESGRPAG